MQPNITYLIANYNQEIYITDCIDSLEKQSNPHWRAIIYDDASTDNSILLIKKILNKLSHKKITFLAGDKNWGKFYALHQLILTAKTELVAILDPDDSLHPEATAKILELYKKNSQIKWAHSFYQEVDENLKNPIRKLGKSIPNSLSYLAYGNITHLLSFKKSIYKECEPLKAEVLYVEDKDLIYKLEEKGTGGFIPQILYFYRRVPNKSATHNKKNRLIGAKNHYQVQKKALKRRKITGLQCYCYQILFWLIKCYYPYRYPFLIRGGFYVLHRFLRILFMPILRNKFIRK